MHVSVCPYAPTPPPHPSPERPTTTTTLFRSHSLALPRCWKTYYGERCEIPTLILGTGRKESGGTGLTQTVLVIIAVVLSVLSCLAVLLVACAQ